MELGHDRCSRFARMAFTVMLAVAWVLPARMAVAAPAAGEPAGTLDDAAAKQRIAAARRLCELAKEDLAAPGADPSDIAAQAESLGKDPKRIFAFVRDEISFEPYAGILRGARGTLAGRAGNTADKALLLKAMLEASGKTCQFMAAKLPMAASQKMVDAFLSAPTAKGAFAQFVEPAGGEEAMLAFAKRSGIEAGKLRAIRDRMAEESQKFWAGANECVEGNAQYLGKQLQQAKVELGRSRDAWVEQLIARVTDHVWVQMREGEAWQDMDPSMSGAQAGQTMVEGGTVLKDLDSLRYRVTFKLLYRKSEAGKASDVSLVSVPLYADETMYACPGLSIYPAESLGDSNALAKMPPEALAAKLAKVRKFQAVVTAGPKSYPAKPFDLDGKTYDVTPAGILSGAGDIGKSVGGVMGGFGGLGGGDEAPPAPKFIELAAQLTMEYPGQPAREQRRVLLSADDVKRGIQPLLHWEMLIQPHVLSTREIAMGSLRRIVTAAEPLLDVQESGKVESETTAKISKIASDTWPAGLAQWALLRQEHLGRLLKDRAAVVAIQASPQIAIIEQRMSFDAKTDTACGRVRIDIVSNAIDIIPRKAEASALAAQTAMRQGIFDTLAEEALLKRSAPCGKLVSAMKELERARSDDSPLAVFSPKSPAAGVKLDKSDLSWIGSYESGDARVLARSGGKGGSDVDLAWWSIDPATGAILGRTSGGAGGAMAEYSQQLRIIVGGFLCGIVTGAKLAGDQAKHDPNTGKKFALRLAGCVAAVGFGVGGYVYSSVAWAKEAFAWAGIIVGGAVGLSTL